MANKHSRQGLALGVSLVMGATTLGVLPAQAVDYENLELTIAADDTNGVLATTMENDFELELEWDISDASDLAHLKYEVTFMSSDESTIDAKGSATGLSWDAAEDDIDEIEEYDTFEDTFAHEGSDIISAPAHITGDDEIATFRKTTTQYYNGGGFCDSSSETLNLNINSVPNDDTTYNTGCDYDGIGGEDEGNTFIEYDYESGYTGSLDEPAPSSFESVLLLEAVYSEDAYVDVVVEAWLDKDGDNVKDLTESYAAPVTVRFWNPNALTPVLVLADEGKVWYEDIETTESLVTETYISQELNEHYTTTLTDVNDNYTVVNILDYEYQRDGHVLETSVGASYKAALTDFAFGTGDTPDYSGKHLFESATILADPSSINRASVVDADQTDEDTFFSEPNTVEKIVSGPLAVSFLARTVTAVTGEVVEATLVNATNTEDAEIRSDVETVTYVFTLVNEDDLDEDLNPAPVAGASVTISGEYDDDLEGALTINGVSIVDEEDADDVSVAFEVTGTSNAAGEVVLEITSSNPHSDLYVYFAGVSTQGEDFEVDADLEWDDSSWDLVDELNSEDSGNNYDSLRTVAVGESTTIKYDVRDQWYQMPANGTAQLKFYVEDSSSADRDFDGDYAGPVSVVNGAASITISDSDPESVEGTFVIRAELDVREEDGSWYAEADQDSTEIEYVDDATVALIQQDEDGAEAGIAYNDFMTVNSQLVRWTAAMEDTEVLMQEDGQYDGINGYVRNADGLGLAGVRVTASGAGLQFWDTDDEFYGEGSLTLFTDEEGYYDFEVQGHTVGEHTVTITAGGKSATATYTVTDENVRAHNVAITSAFAGKAGTADTLTALVTDRYGNTMTVGETVTFTKVSGSGYIQEEDGTVTTDEDGVATATLIIMGGEIGFNSTVRAAITQDDFAATSNSAAAQRSAGDPNLGKTTAWTKLQTDGTAKMYAKNIVGAGKVQFFHNNKEIAWVRAADALNPKLRAANGAFYLVRTVELVDGKNVLEVYIDGERVRRTAYSK